MPQYAILLYAPIDDEDGPVVNDDEAQERQSEGMREHDRYSQELQDEGVMIAAFGLESYEAATSDQGRGLHRRSVHRIKGSGPGRVCARSTRS